MCEFKIKSFTSFNYDIIVNMGIFMYSKKTSSESSYSNIILVTKKKLTIIFCGNSDDRLSIYLAGKQTFLKTSSRSYVVYIR